ncbi:MAG: LysM peptidoglycan-binding domain-containing M23 family metallopeptidase [Chloroflexota bacterium]
MSSAKMQGMWPQPATRRALSPAVVAVLILFTYLALPADLFGQDNGQTPPPAHVVEPGDTWQALAYRYGLSIEQLQAVNPHPNPRRQPVIGDTIDLPAEAGPPRSGMIVAGHEGGVLQSAARHQLNPWYLAHTNGLRNPFRPLFQRPLFVPGGEGAPRQLPPGFQQLELSRVPAQPGQALAIRGQVDGPEQATVTLGSAQFDTFIQGQRFVSLGATGAFFTPGAPELTIGTPGAPLWSQPWRIVPGVWEYDQVTLTGAAAEIDQEAIAAERERLFQIWSRTTPEPQWQGPFQTPIDDYLAVSSTYGARRSYNGGPYSTYHEGVDFSAYAGTPVYASGDGTVVLAEMLYVRGGAVIIDHGLGVFSGYYHMSAVHAQPGQVVQAGTLVGEVGTKGLSSGNHLHWDLLVARTWVDAAAWRDQNLACWILEGWGQSCAPS